MFIDTHCHISSEYYDNIDFIIKENRKNNISKIVVSACDRKSFEEAFELTNQYDDLFLTIGFHPDTVDSVTDADLKDLENFIKSNKKIVGIGEIGLDYYYVQDNKSSQKKLFEEQLSLAEKLNMPVVIHSREATKDTIDILKKYNVTGVIHCFSGSVESAHIYIKMGYKIGIGGVVTFKNSNLFKVVESIGVENIVLETDSPYLAPVPFRGKINSSKYIPYIAERVAEILDLDINKVAKITSFNAVELFDLDRNLW